MGKGGGGGVDDGKANRCMLRKAFLGRTGHFWVEPGFLGRSMHFGVEPGFIVSNECYKFALTHVEKN